VAAVADDIAAMVALNYAGFGARGFQMDARGRMAWPARVLLAPYRLAARINALLWTRRLPPLREVLPGLWLGSLPRLPRLGSGRRQATVVSLCAELQAPGFARCHCLPWLDLVPASPAALRRAADAIDRAVQRGEPVVVGCALGFSRSAAALACWLARSGRARDVESALRQLRRSHPQMVLDADWQAACGRRCGHDRHGSVQPQARRRPHTGRGHRAAAAGRRAHDRARWAWRVPAWPAAALLLAPLPVPARGRGMGRSGPAAAGTRAGAAAGLRRRPVCRPGARRTADRAVTGCAGPGTADPAPAGRLLPRCARWPTACGCAQRLLAWHTLGVALQAAAALTLLLARGTA
jgi:protein-tyrosine phosphatase